MNHKNYLANEDYAAILPDLIYKLRAVSEPLRDAFELSGGSFLENSEAMVGMGEIVHEVADDLRQICNKMTGRKIKAPEVKP